MSPQKLRAEPSWEGSLQTELRQGSKRDHTGLGWALHPVSVLIKDRKGHPDMGRSPCDTEAEIEVMLLQI